MILGVAHHTVAICPHDDEWQIQAYHMMKRLEKLLVGIAVDIRHVGSTAVPSIAANPVIDMALGVVSDKDIAKVCSALLEDGFEEDRSYVSFARVFYLQHDGLRTYQIFVVVVGSVGWRRLVCFRDFLNSDPEYARKYGENNYNSYDLPFDEYIAQKNLLVESVLMRIRR